MSKQNKPPELRDSDDYKALRKTMEDYRSLLDESSDPLFSFYSDGTYRYVNRAFAEGVGKGQDEIIGAHIRDIFPPEEAEGRFAIVKWVFDNADTRVIEVRVPRPDGDRYYITTAKPVMDNSGEVSSVICTSKDITGRKKAEDALKESEEKYQKLFNNEIDAICIFEVASRRIVDVNESFLKLYGYTRDETLQLTADDFSAEPEATRAAIRKSAESGDSLIPIRLHKKKDGTELFVELSAGPFTWKGTDVMFAVIRDITQRKRFEEELEAKNEQLLELGRIKDSLLRDVAHELKTPVAKHSMQMEILKTLIYTKKPSEAEKKALMVMEEGIRRQESVIRNFLDLSRLESGGRKYRKEEVALDSMFAELRKNYQYAIDGYGMEFQVDVPSIRIYSDEEMLWHVFSNLVNNAIKFRRGNVPLRVRIAADIADGEITIRTIDNGSGMARQEMEEVFTRFYQLSPSTEGSGIGLAICRRIIDDLGGRIFITPNAEADGITMNVTLPLEGVS